MYKCAKTNSALNESYCFSKEPEEANIEHQLKSQKAIHYHANLNTVQVTTKRVYKEPPPSRQNHPCPDAQNMYANHNFQCVHLATGNVLPVLYTDRYWQQRDLLCRIDLPIPSITLNTAAIAKHINTKEDVLLMEKDAVCLFVNTYWFLPHTSRLSHLELWKRYKRKYEFVYTILNNGKFKENKV